MWRLYKRVHISWILALASACFVAGVAFSLLWRVPWWWGFIGLALVVAALFFRSQVWLVAGAAGGILMGFGVGSAHAAWRDVYTVYVGRVVSIEGRVKEDISRSHSGMYSVQIDDVTLGGKSYPGTLLVTIRAPTEAKRGDRVMVSGLVGDGFGSFPATLTLAQIVRIYVTEGVDVGRELRDWFADRVRTAIPEPQASLGIGFLTGQKSALPDDLSEALKVAGLTHIVVASGYNLTVLVRLMRRLFMKVSKYVSMVASLMMVGAFMAIAGLGPSMTRAGLVSMVSLFAWYYGRAFHPFVLLPLAAAVTVAIHPSYAWGDLGWQLSFAAFLGVMIVGPLMRQYFFGEKEPGIFASTLIETVAAHSVTVPIIALGFGTVSNVAIIANMLVVPLVPIAMLLTFISGLWAVAGLGMVWLVAVPTEWLLGYMVNVANTVAGMDWAQSGVSREPWVWGTYVSVLLAICWWMWRVTRYNFRGVDTIL